MAGPKTPEELHRERQEAQEQLELLLNASRPKNLREGVTTGVSNIVAGAVGAAGVAVLLPTMGFVAGVRGGGIIGGALGVAVGAGAGIIGAAALVVGGAVSGVAQIGRGIAAIPQSIVAPRQGKWWNENLGKWVSTKMENEKALLKDIPDDDSDILRQYEDELDASAAFGGDSSKVLDMHYYDCLELPASAEPSLIKRRYYILAKRYHPDKVGVEDKESAEKFKEIAEAYQVLCDPELRKIYDKTGRAGLSPDKKSAADNGFVGMDPILLFAFLFGSDKFHNYIGRLSTATASRVGDTPKVTIEKARLLQHRRVTRMAIYLIEKITPWVDVKKGCAHDKTNDVLEDIESAWRLEAIELSHASFGYQMVTTIGKIYNLLAIVYEGSLDSGQGLPSLSKWAKKNKAAMDTKREENRVRMDLLRAGLDLMKLQAELQQKMEEAKTEEEKVAIAKELENGAKGVIVRQLWTMTVVDITAALYEATQMTFFDQSMADKGIRKLRAAAIKSLGSIWMQVPEDSVSDTEAAKDAKQLYEEAAFAAMVETVKRKDDAAHGAPTAT